MEIQGYFTKKGLALSAKLSAGAVLTITRIVAGSGETADPGAAASLPQIKQELRVNAPKQSGNTTVTPVMLVAAEAAEAYSLTELGVYAEDPDEGEILYKVYRLGEPVDISPASRLVLRFYLEETVSQALNVTVNCSLAGLVTEEEFLPVETVVRATAATGKTVHLTAEELKLFLDALPRLLTENLQLYVSGTVTEVIDLRGFCGCGSLTIRASESGCTFQKNMFVAGCEIYVRLIGLSFQGDEESITNETFKALLAVDRSDNVSVESCTFTGNSAHNAISVQTASHCDINTCTINNCLAACYVVGGSIVHMLNITASGNGRGINIYWGGIVAISGTTADTVGGASNSVVGGLIVRNNALVA